jgi:uncharacterized protein (DUF2235 family)
MATRIILLSDGTGNAASKVWRTNVWRVFESLDLTGSDQVAIYDDGVGTSAFKPLAILAGAFGWGLKRNVIDLYKFVCRNYRSKNDEIFGFGFSRGAFTIRIVVGLIFDQGLVPYETEAELHRRARDAYRAFRRKNFHTVWRIEEPFRFVRDLVIPSSYDKTKNKQVERIRFLGLWDTVAAYGLPIEEMTRGVSEWIWPLELPERRLCDGVDRACHALSLDDERTTFHPVLWDERHETPVVPDHDGIYRTEKERISQVWFAGTHSNVGGGYPDDSLAHIPLCWIMAEAQQYGLRYKTNPPADPDAMAQRRAARDKDGRLYDSRHGLGGYYRYGPRKILDLSHMRFSKNPDDEVQITLPKIHESALKRIREGAHLYAPIGFPETYAVVTEGRDVLPAPRNPYESPAHAESRSKAQEEVWNLVWCRRVVYFATVFASLYLLLYPLVRALPRTDEFTTSLRPVSDLIRLIGGFLPSALDPWLNAYARRPGQFLVAAALVVFLMLLGSAIGGKITDRMRTIWKSDEPVVRRGLLHELIYGLRTSPLYQWILWATKRHVAPFVFAIAFLYLGLTFASHILFNIQDAAGWVCQEKPVEYEHNPDHPNRITVQPDKELINLGPGETKLTSGSTSDPVTDATRLPVFSTSELCQSMGVWVERNGRYLIRFDSTDSFKDGDIDGSEGFYSTSPSSIKQQAAMLAAVPLRRELIRPWFRVVVRIGGKGGEEMFLDPDLTDKLLINEPIRATRDGELFLFVNDAVIGIPGFNGYFYKWFYDNNKGSARVTIKRL